MSDDLDFATTVDENSGMSYEDILEAVEHENHKQSGNDTSTGYEEADKLDGKSEVPQGMEDDSSFEDRNARGDATECYENGTPGAASSQPEAMQEDSDDFCASPNSSSDGGKENSSLYTPKSGKTNDGKTNAKNAKEGPASPADDIAREAGIVLENKVQEVQEWCKKLLKEITVYVQVANKTNEEYLRIQQLEHQESERLDRVEPDVKGATSQLLGYPFYDGAAQNQNGAASFDTNRVE
ncbi:MAG: hypothetical protein SGBAC_007181 [Bacillariaceae sp.]